MNYRALIGLLGVLVAAIATELNDEVSSIALANIQGGFGISHDPGTWITSLYLSAEVVGMAISPWLMVTFSLRRFMLFVIALCAVSSVLVPFAPNISAIYALRVLQGLSGGLAVPLLMATALRVLTPEIRLYGLAVYALSATFAPALSTTLAALWADVVGWQFVFYEAVPFCAAAAVLVWWGLPQDPLKLDRFRILDWRGVLLVIFGFGSLSTMLDQGSRLDWFDSNLISVLALISVVAIPMLLLNEWFHPVPLLKLQLLLRRNFAYGGIALFLFLIIGQSASTIPLIYLQEVQGYLPLQAYPVTLEVALAQLVLLPAIAALLDYPGVDARMVSFIGLTLILTACIGDSYVTISWNRDQFYLWQAFQAVGQPMVVVPLLMIATNAVKPEEGPFASGLINTPRALAAATATWLVNLITSWRGSLHSDRIIDQLGQERWRLPRGAEANLSQTVQQQVTILTVSDAFLIMAALTIGLIMILLVLPVRTMPPRIEMAKK